MADAPRIEFPCRYPIRVIGAAHASFRADVVGIVRRHAPEVADQHVEERPSRAGNYVSLVISIEATGEAQLVALHADLRQLDAVRLVL